MLTIGSFAPRVSYRSLFRPRFLAIAFCLASLALLLRVPKALADPDNDKPTAQSSATADGAYVGSKVCADCHRQIYEEFSQTDMGRSLATVTPSLFEKIPKSAQVFDQRSHRYFELFAQNGEFFQTEYEKTSDGKDLFRETHKMEWTIGSGANGFGAIVRRGDSLFEAPLSYYSTPGAWGLSPGYESNDFGFARPILPACISCHSGKPQPVPDGNGRFREPPFSEQAIGCENCHGPGALHAVERLQDAPFPTGSDTTIVNPSKLPSWLADNICMSCHQTGDVSILRSGKTFQDFRPGTPLDETLTIFMVPLKRASVTQSDLLQHYLSMTLSKCYRNSGRRLSCITCHDPHVQPSEQQAPAYYREKCLTCHTEKSCAVALTVRQHKNPPDNCTACHMPKRDVKVISHAVLTNHRIVAVAEEPFPEAAFHLTTPQLPELVRLTAIPGEPETMASSLTLLQAYGQLLMGSHTEFRERYYSLAKQLEPQYPNNVDVLEALAAAALEHKDREGTAEAIRYLNRAVEQGTTSPADFEQLAVLLARAGRWQEANVILQEGIKRIPYDAEFYRLMAENDLALNKPTDALSVIERGVEIYPQDATIRRTLEQCRRAIPKN